MREGCEGGVSVDEPDDDVKITITAGGHKPIHTTGKKLEELADSMEEPKDKDVQDEIFERNKPDFEGGEVDFVQTKVLSAKLDLLGGDQGVHPQMGDFQTFLITGKVAAIEGKTHKDKEGEEYLIKTISYEIRKHAAVPEDKSADMYLEVIEK